jgi:formylmethanofuran dehydrogenase subunit B
MVGRNCTAFKTPPAEFVGMTDPHETARLCTFCSLLCELDREDASPDFGEAFCSRRHREWEIVTSARRDAALPTIDSDDAIDAAQKILANSKDVLVTGRVHCVETARAAIQLARRFSGMLDLWESDAGMDAVLAIQKNGLNSVSLAEARERTDCWIVIGSDGLLEEVPRLPQATSNGRKVPMLLMGNWSAPSIAAWKDAGFDVVGIPCSMKRIPGALAEATRQAQNMEWDSQVGEWLHQAKYLTVLWSGRELTYASNNITNRELWIESLLHWIAQRNEVIRAGALIWSSLEAGFQQTCTWQTGFPGRIRFLRQGAEYRPHEYVAKRWVARKAGTAKGEDARTPSKPCIVWVDDTSESLPDPIVQAGVPLVVLSPRKPTLDHPSMVWLPCASTGIESTEAYFRGDQSLLVSGRNPVSITELPEVPSGGSRLRANQWIARLIAS